MLIWLNTERERREDVAEVSGDIEDEVHGNVGPRVLVIFEEQNLTVPKVKKASPEAHEALGDLNFAGRASRMNMLAIAQRYSAKAAGGGDVRATVNARILGRYDKPAWKMLAEAFPMPAMSNHPGPGAGRHRPGRRSANAVHRRAGSPRLRPVRAGRHLPGGDARPMRDRESRRNVAAR